MRIKYLYQLLGSHISILLIAFLILSLLFSYYAEEVVYQNKVEELTTYGEDILTELYEQPSQNKSYLLTQYTNVLSSRHIYFSIFGNNGNVLFPSISRFPMIKLTTEEWNQITQGKSVVVKHDFKRFDQEVSLVAIPYMQNGQLLGGILLTAPISGSREMVSQLNQYLVYTVLIVLTVSVLLSWLLAKLHVNRIQRIRVGTSMISSGNYDVYVPHSSLDEIGELGADFNHMAEKLSASHEKIERLEKRRRQFIADVSHELRTPLTTISGLIEGLKNDMIPEADKEKGMNLIEQESKRLIRLVNENLDYEKIRSNQVVLEKDRIQLIEVYEIIKEHLWGTAEAKNNQMIIDITDDVWVWADYDRLIQILMNITKNSLQFTSDGTITLRGKSSHQKTIIEIQDSGIGIIAEDIESIWNRFYKADLSRTSNPYGEFGLGLSIVKQLVELHDGTIEVFSEKNKGTTFVISLPSQNV